MVYILSKGKPPHFLKKRMIVKIKLKLNTYLC